MFLAREKNYFAQEGVSDISLIEYTSLGDARRAFERGQINGMACTFVEVLQAREHSKRSPQVFFVTDFSNGADVILAREPIRNIQDLKGKRIGLELASLGIFMLARALETAGMSVKDLTPVPMDQMEMERAFANGKVDAVITYPPVSESILRQGGVKTVFNSAQIPGEVVDVIALDADLLAGNEKTIAGFLRAWDRGLEYARANPDEAHRFMGAREHLSVAEFRQALSGIRVLDTHQQSHYFEPGGILSHAVKTTDQALRAVGQIVGPDRTGEVLKKMPVLISQFR